VFDVVVEPGFIVDAIGFAVVGAAVGAAVGAWVGAAVGPPPPLQSHMSAGQLGGVQLQLLTHQASMVGLPAQEPIATHWPPTGGAVVTGPAVGELVGLAVVTGALVGLAVVGNGPLVTSLPDRDMSEQALKFSWGPHPTAPEPSGQVPQLLPVV